MQNGDVFQHKYRILRHIGRGSWAETYEAEDLRTPVRVMIKVLRKDARLNHEVFFAPDAVAIPTLESPHVAQVREIGELVTGRTFIVTEYFQADDLRTHLAHRGGTPSTEIVAIIVQALTGLADAHDAGIIHGNLTPESIVVTRGVDGSNQAKLIDFGIRLVLIALPTSRELDRMWDDDSEQTPTHVFPSVPGYGEHFDVLAICTVLFECITGLPSTLISPSFPHDAPGNFDFFASRPDVDAALARILIKGLSRSPGEGYQSARELHFALTQWLQLQLRARERAQAHTPSRMRAFVVDAKSPSSIPPMTTAHPVVMEPDVASSDTLKRKYLLSALIAATALTLMASAFLVNARKSAAAESTFSSAPPEPAAFQNAVIPNVDPGVKQDAGAD